MIGLFNLYQATPVAGVYLQNAGLMWVLPIAVAVFGAVFFMNNLTSAKSSFKDQLAIVGRKHTWIMAFIYIGTFGSFIGYSAAFPLLIKTQFPAVTIAIAFLGPLVGSLSRPLGGLLADKVGGAIVTFWNFIAMGAATIGVLYFVGIKDFTGFLAMFLILFVTTGIGNGSTYRMIPSIFREENLHKARGKGEAGRALALKVASIESGAALGFIGAIGACGGYLIPSGFGKSIAVTGGPQLALEIYLAFYAVCLALDLVVLPAQEPCGVERDEPRRSARVTLNIDSTSSRSRGEVATKQEKQERTMTPDQVKLVQQSFAKVAPISETAAVLFYDRLFEIAPAVKAMFPADMTEQRKKLMATLAVVVNGLGNLESILPAASALAKRHVSYGAKAEHYPVVGAALLWTLEKGLGDAWTPDVADAWTAAYGTLSGYMISEAYGRPQAAE